MNRTLGFVLGAALLVAALSAGGYYWFLKESECPAPAMYLPNADEDVCVQTNFSMIYLTFEHPVELGPFVYAVGTVPGIDLDTSRVSDDRRVLRLVYYATKTDQSRFITNVSAVIDNPALFQK